jgi:hypothetical protein
MTDPSQLTLPEVILRVQRKVGVDADADPQRQTWNAIFHALGCQNEEPLGALATPLDKQRARIIDAAKSYLGTREVGQNGGPRVDEILGACGLAGTRNPYCGCFNRRCYDLAGLKDKGPQKGDGAWSPNWVDRATWTQSQGGITPLPGDTFGIYFESKGRISHTGMVIEWSNSHVLTIEGNTGAASAVGSEADRNGDGVYMKRRRVSEIHSVRNWLA